MMFSRDGGEKKKQTLCLRSMFAFAMSLASVMPVHVQVLANGQSNPTDDELKLKLLDP